MAKMKINEIISGCRWRGMAKRYINGEKPA
jgi:hypothetical protein